MLACACTHMRACVHRCIYVCVHMHAYVYVDVHVRFYVCVFMSFNGNLGWGITYCTSVLNVDSKAQLSLW